MPFRSEHMQVSKVLGQLLYLGPAPNNPNKLSPIGFLLGCRLPALGGVGEALPLSESQFPAAVAASVIDGIQSA